MLKLKYWPCAELRIHTTFPENPNDISEIAKAELISIALKTGFPVYVINKVDKWEICLDKTMIFQSINPISTKA